MGNLISFEHVNKRYDDSFSLRDITFQVEDGSVVGFVGANGAGKTTTIRTLLGLTPIDAGRIELFGEPFGIHASPAQARRVKERIGLVLDTCPFMGDATVKTAGAIMRAAFKTWNQELFERYLRLFELSASKRVKDLSRGMGMRLQLACAFAHEPDLLILDEATAGLDPLARDEVLDMLRDWMSDERGMLISSHITSDLEKIADSVVGIDQGAILFNLEKDAITDEMGIARCRAADLDQVLPYLRSETTRLIRHEYGVDVLVPDRFAFTRQFPEIPCDRMTIESYLQLSLKGEQ